MKSTLYISVPSSPMIFGRLKCSILSLVLTLNSAHESSFNLSDVIYLVFYVMPSTFISDIL